MHSQYRRSNGWQLFISFLRALGILMFPLTFLILHLTNGQLLGGDSPKSKPHTAFINMRGEIATGGAIDADRYIPAIKKAFEADSSMAVILRINSPGGSPVPSGRIYDEVVELRKKHPEKKAYAVIDDIGASGGYYIAASTDAIYADRASLVGSIGVISATFGFTGLMEKLGIERRAITAGEHKALLDPFSPLDPVIKKFWAELLAQTNEQFVSRVKAGRGDRLKDNPKIFSGLIWNGEQAMDLGLIDGLGSMDSVARTVVGESNLVDYSPREDFFMRFSRRAKVEAQNFFGSALPAMK